jgi:mannose-1-phosphate guanylyltransferase
MFVMRADVLLDSLKQYQPDLFSAICAIADAWDQGEECRKQALRQHWYGLEKIAFDYAIAEPLSADGGVAVVPGGFGWDDIGDFNSLAALLPSYNRQNIKILGNQDDVVFLDSAGDIVAAQAGRTVALLGVDDMVVIDTPDALLVAPRARSQEVKNMVTKLSGLGRDAVL